MPERRCVLTAGKLSRGADLLQKGGLRRVFLHARYRAIERFYERWLGVDTRGHLSKQDLGLQDEDAREYSTVPYDVFFTLLRSIDRDWRRSTFVDYGAGKGRATVAASTYPFERVIAVELVPALAAAAQENVRRMRHRRAGAIEVLNLDARAFRLPDTASVLFFYNPFAGAILDHVVRQLRDSWHRAPRAIDVIYVNDEYFARAVAGEPWIGKVAERAFYPTLTCGVYRTRENAID